jgi:hypothetical protein
MNMPELMHMAEATGAVPGHIAGGQAPTGVGGLFAQLLSAQHAGATPLANGPPVVASDAGGAAAMLLAAAGAIVDGAGQGGEAQSGDEAAAATVGSMLLMARLGVHDAGPAPPVATPEGVAPKAGQLASFVGATVAGAQGASPEIAAVAAMQSKVIAGATPMVEPNAVATVVTPSQNGGGATPNLSAPLIPPEVGVPVVATRIGTAINTGLLGTVPGQVSGDGTVTPTVTGAVDPLPVLERAGPILEAVVPGTPRGATPSGGTPIEAHGEPVPPPVSASAKPLVQPASARTPQVSVTPGAYTVPKVDPAPSALPHAAPPALLAGTSSGPPAILEADGLARALASDQAAKALIAAPEATSGGSPHALVKDMPALVRGAQPSVDLLTPNGRFVESPVQGTLSVQSAASTLAAGFSGEGLGSGFSSSSEGNAPPAPAPDSGTGVPKGTFAAVMERPAGSVSGSGDPQSSVPIERPTTSTVDGVAVKSVRFLMANQEPVLKVRLIPEHLGEMQVVVRTTTSGVHVELSAANAVVREALEGQLHGLREHFAQEGIEVARISITSEGPSSQSGQQSAGRSHGTPNGSGRSAMDDGQQEQDAPGNGSGQSPGDSSLQKGALNVYV